MQHFVVLRFSAIGDVVLVLPVLQRILTLNSNIEITIVTRPAFAFFFANIDRLNVLSADIDKENKSIFGLYKLAKKINTIPNLEAVIDLHDVLRTKIIRNLLKIKKHKIIVFDKGRKEKKHFIQNKNANNLIHTTQRYANAFAQLGLQVDTNFAYPAIQLNDEYKSVAFTFFTTHKGAYNIGIAPFAKHQGKIFPAPKMEELLYLLQQENVKIFLFGGGANEEIQMKTWRKKYSNICLTNTLSFAHQIALMTCLNVVLAMDSANMHLASLQNVPVVSIWGATHTGLGFYALQNLQHSIGINRSELLCRPCSVFGNKPCQLRDTPYKCMQEVEVDKIKEKLMAFN